MAGNLWVTNTQGQLLYSPLLSKEVAHASQPKMRFVQFCEMKEEWGKNAGETFVFDRYSDIDTQGGQLTETATIPTSSFRVYQGTATLYEWGRAIPFTKKYEDLAQVGSRKDVVQVLANDHAKVFDTAVENQFDQCAIRYVGTGTAGGAFTTNGTATLTCTSPFNKYHCKQMVDYMFQTLKCEPYDGDHYMAILTTDAKRGIYDDVESMLQYTKYPASGEFGRYYDTRFVKTNHAMSNAIGASSAYGEGYMFGAIDGIGPVYRGVAVPVRIIPKEVTDYGRSLGLAWYAIEGHKITHDSNSSADRTIAKYTSA